MDLEFEKKQSLAITKLYNAALMGDVPSLRNMLEKDQYILDRCIFEKSCGYMKSPLHVAASKGHVEIVETIISKKPNLCFLRDQDGMNPIHVASIEGHVNVLSVLYAMNSHAARERTNGGDTILHLCVKHKHLEALKMLLELTKDDELLNCKDSNGNTVLHLAVTGKQVEMVNSILEQPRTMEKNAINNNGLTALDCLPKTENKKDVMGKPEIRKVDSDSVDVDDEIRESLGNVKALRAKDVLKIQNKSWVENQSQALMVVASLIATMAFQVVLSPPGGFWQDTVVSCQKNATLNANNKHATLNALMHATTGTGMSSSASSSTSASSSSNSGSSSSASASASSSANADADSNETVDYLSTCHVAGMPIAGDYFPRLFNLLVIWNSLALISSLIVILLLISGFRSRKYFVEILRITMWISVTATTATYSLSLSAINWQINKLGNRLLPADPISTVWKFVVATMLFGRILQFVVNFIRTRPIMQSRFSNLISTTPCTCPPSCLKA